MNLSGGKKRYADGFSFASFNLRRLRLKQIYPQNASRLVGSSQRQNEVAIKGSWVSSIVIKPEKKCIRCSVFPSGKKKSCVDSVYKETCGHYVCLYVLLKLGKFKGETPRTVPDQSLYTGCRGAPVRTWSLCGAAGGQWEIWSADWNSLKLCHLSVSDWSWRLRVWKWRKSGGVEWEERGFIRSP